nr:DUF6765 family protein [Desulfobacula sp.]
MARMAGLRPKAAGTIATASQYVDDAVDADIRHHEKGNKLAPIVTAHKLLELTENRDVNDQPFVWVPFHFFPGNKGKDFTEQLLCRKDSPLINELIDHYLDLHDCPFALELIGLVAHVYADTFSHSGFSGVSSRQNKVDAASITPLNAAAPTATYLDKKLDSFFRMFGFQGGLWTNVRRSIISNGAVAVLPDLPYLEWSFRYEHSPEIFKRNNVDTFLEACRKMHAMFQRFVSLSTGHDDGTSGIDFSTKEDRIKDILSFQDGKTQRSEKWRTAFTKGELGIKPGEEIPLYDPALWDKQRNHFPGLDKPQKVAASNIYHFYQAASLHRHYLLRELLPKHNLIVV